MALSRALAAGLLAAGTHAVAAPAEACPDCELGRRARSEVWRDGFGWNLFLTLIPFLIIGAICLLAEAIGRPRAGSGEGTEGRIRS